MTKTNTSYYDELPFFAKWSETSQTIIVNIMLADKSLQTERSKFERIQELTFALKSEVDELLEELMVGLDDVIDKIEKRFKNGTLDIGVIEERFYLTMFDFAISKLKALELDEEGKKQLNSLIEARKEHDR